MIRQDKLGDVVLSTPVFEAIKIAFPNSSLSVMVAASNEIVPKLSPFVDEVMATSYRPTLLAAARSAIHLRRKKFSAALVLKSESRSHTLISKLAGIQIRVGSTSKAYGARLTHNLPAHGRRTHEVEQNLEHLEPIGIDPNYNLPLHFHSRSEAKLNVQNLTVESTVVIHPGTGGSSRSWSLDQFAQMGETVANSFEGQFLISGAMQDETLAENLAMKIPRARSIAGQTTLEEFAAVLSSSQLVIAANTSAIHIAAANKTPCVMVEPFPPVEWRINRWRPWQVPHRVFGANKVCPGCTSDQCNRRGNDCICSISPDSVAQGALELLGEI